MGPTHGCSIVNAAVDRSAEQSPDDSGEHARGGSFPLLVVVRFVVVIVVVIVVVRFLFLTHALFFSMVVMLFFVGMVVMLFDMTVKAFFAIGIGGASIAHSTSRCTGHKGKSCNGSQKHIRFHGFLQKKNQMQDVT